MPTVAVLGTFDTKGEEHAFVADQISARGHRVLAIDVGTLGPPTFAPDVPRDVVARAAGADAAELARAADRGAAVAAMTRGAPIVLADLFARRQVDAVISLGGGGGTAIATAAMRGLPVGVPKVMVSTLAGGDVGPYVGVTDVVMFPAIVDVAGLNRISRAILANAAGAVCGMVEAAAPAPPDGADDRPVIAATQFGNTTACVDHARSVLARAGYEVLVFHATGAGGRTMESLVESGLIAGVLDVTTTEWADELAGGVLSAGPGRLDAAARRGTPAVVSTGCLDMVNFGPPDTVPARYADRLLYPHNPHVTLMRTTAAECEQLGRILAEKLNASIGPVTVLVPLKGQSALGAPGHPFHDERADRALRDSLRANLRPDVPYREFDHNINDPAFAEACAAALLDLLNAKRP
jgi:uncharacterized protein (UPF0261 family)